MGGKPNMEGDVCPILLVRSGEDLAGLRQTTLIVLRNRH